MSTGIPALSLREAASLFDMRDTAAWLAAVPALFDAHGDRLAFDVPGLRSLALRNPTDFTEVLTSEDWDKRADLHKYHQLLMGNGLVTSKTTEAWRHRRRAIQPLFSHKALTDYLPRMVDGLQTAMAHWEPGTVDAHMTLRDATTRINFACFLREDFDAHLDTIHHFMDVLAEPQSPWDLAVPAWVPTPLMRRHKAVLGELDGLIREVVAHRRAEGVDRGDYLSALMKAAETVPEARIDAVALRDEVVTLLVAGHETTASGMAWALYELAARPDLQDRIAAEAAELPQPWSQDGLGQMSTAGGVIYEALRLYPPVMLFVPRYNEVATRIGDAEVPAGTTAVMFPYASMRHPELYEEPDAFDPERPKRTDAWMPFSVGRRKCPGEAMALLEMRLFLATICSRWRFERARPVEPVFVNGALMPSGGVPLEITRR